MLSVLIVLVLAFLSIPAILFAVESSTATATIWEFLSTFPTDHPLATFIIALIVGLVGQKGTPIIWFLLHVLKSVRDKLFDDTEAACALWRLAAIVSGFWPNKSKKILAYAPRHWREVILEGKDPTFRLVAVPLSKVIDVQNMLSGKRVVGPGDQSVTTREPDSDESKPDLPNPAGG